MSPDLNREKSDSNDLEKRLSNLEVTSALTDSTKRGLKPDEISEGSETPSLSVKRPRFEELKQIASFHIIRELGAGGMGKVFEAEDSLLHRRVALKVMKTDLPDEKEAKERFIREARAAAAVTHDHIVIIHYVGEDLGYPFLAMQLLEGENLESRLRKKQPFTVSEILRIGAEIASGLSAAHQKGLIHRDIKPANIWLESPRDRVKILDFGLARAAEGSTQLTGPGLVVGTPSYMSPEQSRGESLDFRSDLFSLGCVLYQLCTGLRPFHGPNIVSIIRNLELHQPPEVKALSPHIPSSLSNLIMRLIAKDREDRPHSAEEVVQALTAIDPVEVKPFFANSSGSGVITPTFLNRSLQSESKSTVKSPIPVVGKSNPNLPVLSTPSVSIGSIPSLPVPPGQTEVSLWQPQPKSRTGGCFVLAFLLMLLGGGGVYYYFEVYDRGTLIIETTDPSIVVDIFHHGVVKEQSISRRQFSLRPGEYHLAISKSAKGMELDPSKIVIERGKTQVVKIRSLGSLNP